MSFNGKYSLILNNIAEEIKNIDSLLISLIDIKETKLQNELINFLTSPSKRIRSVVTILYLKANDITLTQQHYKLLAAVELMHNASLIHDDIIDESKKRRNQETLNSKFGNKMAVISGDYILSKALKYLSELNSAETIAIFADTLSFMCEGETFQYFHKFEIPNLENYIKKTEQKTAKLFQSVLETALIISKISPSMQASEFGKNFGIAFQIRDDIINIKTTKTDINDGIYNAPLIFATNKNDLKSGVEKTYCLLNTYVDKAKNNLDILQDNRYKQLLIELLGLLENE